MIALIASGSFLVRLVQPFGTSVLNMQICYFTQYIVLFLIGLWAGRTDFLRTIPYSFGMSWFRISLAAGGISRRPATLHGNPFSSWDSAWA